MTVITVTTEINEMAGRVYQIELPTFAIAEDVQPQEYEPGGCKRLLMALVNRAIRDAGSRGRGMKNLRLEAQEWLLEHGAALFDYLGYERIRQEDIQQWVDAGCPMPGRGGTIMKG